MPAVSPPILGILRPLANRAGAFALGSGLLAGCATDVPNYSPDADTGSTHAIVTVRRSEDVEAERTSAEAFAQFATVPADADPARALLAAGAVRALPFPGACASLEQLGDTDSATFASGPVEFLEAGDVRIQAGDRATTLAPHAFPSVGGVASGVVYATLDRSEEPLPASAPYVIHASGSGSVPALQIEEHAPAPPSSITLNGIPFAEVAVLPASRPLDLTWNVGDKNDWVYVEIAAPDLSSGVVCTFADEDGAASISNDWVAISGPARISIHRARIRALQASGQSLAGELRFDFELATSVEFE